MRRLISWLAAVHLAVPFVEAQSASSFGDIGPGNTTTSSYEFSFQGLNDPGEGMPLSFGQTVTASISAPAERDTYMFSAAAGDVLAASMAVSSGFLDPDIELYDSQGVLICSAERDSGGSAQFNDCGVSATGTYTLIADDFGNTDTGNYGLHLQRLNNPGNVVPISFGQTLSASVEAPAEKDAYTFSAAAADLIVARMSVSSGFLDPDIELYDSQGVLVCSAEKDSGGAVEFNDCILPAGGKYTLLADDFGNTDTGSYGLHLQRLNDPGEGMPLSFGQTVTASISAPAERDTYMFSAAAGDVLAASMAVSSGFLDPDIELYDSQGVLICSAERDSRPPDLPLLTL
jgi:hypothetical protein